MENLVQTSITSPALPLSWQGPAEALFINKADIQKALLDVKNPYFVVSLDRGVVLAGAGSLLPETRVPNLRAILPATPLSEMGDPGFRRDYHLTYAYVGGAMANGIASEEMVIALGKAGMLGSFGAAGLSPNRVEAAIHAIQGALPEGPYAFNLIHTPGDEALEGRLVDLYLALGVRVVEASAFLGLTPAIVRYRLAGLSRTPQGDVRIQNRVIAKLSRKEIAIRFLEPAPDKIVQQLIAAGTITAEQAELGRYVPMADDITVEADSGGHTDNRPLVCLMPTMVALRDEVQARFNYAQPVRIGAAGGISTPASALAAFAMGAAYILTGSVNQACVEAGASQHTRELLAKAAMTDVTMAPAADMFEMGVRVQLLKSGTLFPMRAQKLYDLYSRYDSVESLPADERQKLEAQVFKRNLDDIWSDCIRFFNERDPQQITKAEANPKRKMALIFRWYLGLSSRWSACGEPGREMDYQIWCGPAMGTFNDWVRGTYLAEYGKRHVVDVALHLLTGAAYQARINALRAAGYTLPSSLETYRPEHSLT